MSAIVSDTHALVWYLNNSPRLSPAAGLAFEQAQTSGELIYVPSNRHRRTALPRGETYI